MSTHIVEITDEIEGASSPQEAAQNLIDSIRSGEEIGVVVRNASDGTISTVFFADGKYVDQT